MFPSTITILSFICLAIVVSIIPLLIANKFGTALETTFIIIVLVYLFTAYEHMDAMMIFSLATTTYANMGLFLNKDKHNMRHSLKRDLANIAHIEIDQERDVRRIIVDLLLTVAVSGGAIAFLLLAPPTYAVLKFLIGISLITITTQMIARIGNYATTSMYWIREGEEERLVIISAFESRDFPIHDLEQVTVESAPDILRLHPLFTFLSQTQDYTSAYQPVLRLEFPGENIFMTPTNIQTWQELFGQYLTDDQGEQALDVLPFWHPTHLKRLAWKGYFAITVKGISAYTGLLLILVWLDVPSYMMIIFILCWWLFNLYISDRVLIQSTDATEITEGDLYDRVRTLCERAQIPQPKLYLIDSPVHNGLATGMNIGRGTVMLTTATTQLSMKAIEAILAHEIIHVKKRDILTNQIARMLFFFVIGMSVYIFYDQFILLSKNLLVFIGLFYVLMLLFPIYLSFVAQFTEMRADYLGAKLLDGGQEQMALGLNELGKAQDKEQAKTVQYSMPDAKPLKKTSNVERDGWFFRVIEFQFQLHPPLYYRIYSLNSDNTWKETIYQWLKARFTESFPDLFDRKSKYI